jgi:tetratricopeptide (TPR) repeat protein
MFKADNALAIMVMACDGRRKAPARRVFEQHLHTQGGRLMKRLRPMIGLACSLAVLAAVLPDRPARAQSAGPKWEKLTNDVAALCHKGAYDKAIAAATSALKMAEKAKGPEDASVAISLDRLAEAYGYKGRYDQVEPLYQRALTIREKALGPDHAETVASLARLAEYYANQNAVAKAEPLYDRALAIREKTLGPDHPDVAATLDSLADLYRKTKRVDQARKLEARAAAIRAAKR